MKKVKVIVVDDSAFMRMIISDMLESTDKVEVIAKFRNGRELINKIDRYSPDVITLDIEMPELDGLETLKVLKEKKIKYPVIMLSSLTKKGSIQTMQCLEFGAVDFIEKGDGANKKIMKEELLSKVLAIAENSRDGAINRINETEQIVNKNEVIVNHKVDAVVIGASTGGPKALHKVLSSIDGDVNVPIFVVQHMPKGFTKAFAERLDKACKLKVVEAEDGMIIEKNTVYIAQGGYHMTVDGKRIKLNEEPSVWGVRPAVDKLFDSAIKTYKGNLLSVILTGMGKDGANGTIGVKEAGGITISEDKSTCTIYGMPKAAFETGKVDMVMMLDKIGEKITTITKGR